MLYIIFEVYVLAVVSIQWQHANDCLEFIIRTMIAGKFLFTSFTHIGCVNVSKIIINLR